LFQYLDNPATIEPVYYLREHQLIGNISSN